MRDSVCSQIHEQELLLDARSCQEKHIADSPARAGWHITARRGRATISDGGAACWPR